jgi:hypothetical protein
MVPWNGGDPQHVGAIDALTFLLGLEGGSAVLGVLPFHWLTSCISDDEPGLSVRQWKDLQLEEATVHYYGDTIGGELWIILP